MLSAQVSSERVCVSDVRRRCAFTLIELLVVVAILALLMAVLLPSLSRTRTLAKIVSCKVNLKQVATMMATYQTDYQGFVPVVFNYYQGTSYKMPARTALLSVALRGYDSRRGTLPPAFNPEAVWSDATRTEYERTYLAAHFVCPFVREREVAQATVGTITVPGPKFASTYTLTQRDGRYESCQTWLWEDIVRGEIPREKHPNDPQEGRPKYSVLSWNKVRVGSTKTPDIPGSISIRDAVDDPAKKKLLANLHRKWDDSDARRRKSANLSEMTTIFCAQGNHMELGRTIANPDSHKTNAGGGTNVAFADTRVEWVRGTQVGWP